MAVLAVQNLPYDTSTVANYKAIMQTFGTALTAFSWVQTADTGQVTWSGVSTLPGNGVFRDFEIWRMNDASQATFPIFMKLEYSTQGTNAPIVRITIGTSSSGAGAITGTILVSLQQVNTTSGASTSLGAANNFACFYSGSSGWFMFLLFQSAGTTNTAVPFAMGIERSKNASGADTDEFVVLTLLDANGNNPNVRYMTKTGVASGTAETRLNAFVSQTGSGNFNGTTAACPQFALVGKLSNPLLNFAVASFADVGEGATVSVNVYGATHTYVGTKVAPGTNGFSNLVGVGATTTACLCRFE